MALGKKYYIDYKSMANEDFTLEIWVEGSTVAATEINLGSSGPEIKYETSNQEKFSYILASSLDIPFIVENTGHADFIQDLRDGTLQEKDVYVHLYNDRDTTRPLWSGFLIMDLSAQEDVSFPYEVKLTAVDGLSLLKDQPFVRDTNLDTGNPVEFPYDVNDVYWNNYTKITNWLEIILLKTGCALTAQGSNANYTYKTSVNWYNSTMPSTNQTDDPLFWTQCKMNSLYERDEEGIYTPKSTYDVLEALCKNWGMRCVYWHHTFHFVQIAEYEASETGTPTAQDNINTREYFYTGTRRSDEATIGESNFGLYDLQFENVTNVNNAGLQKLAGTQYEFYAPIKKVIGGFNVFNDDNRFQGFPALDQTTTTGTIIKSQAISTYKDAADIDGWFCQIPLTFSNIKSQKLGFGNLLIGFSNPRIVDMLVVFSIRAKQTGAASWDKMLVDIGGTLSWVTYDVSTLSGNNWITKNITNIPVGTSQRVIFDSTNYAGGIIPPDAAFTGDWDFEFFTITDGINSRRVEYHGHLEGYNATYPNLARAGSSATTFDYSNPLDLSNNFKGIFAEVAAGVIGNNNVVSETSTSSTDSYTLNVDNLYWGDGAFVDANSTLRVWNGSAFIKASSTGAWGKGTLSGSDNITKLLAEEIIKCQSVASQRMNVTSALSETDKLTSTKLKMVNPVGRLKDINSEKYVFLSGTYNTLRDEWNGVWFQFTYNSGVVVTTADETQTGPISGPVLGGGAQGNAFGNGSQAMRMPWSATTVSERITAGSITNIPIGDLGQAIFKTGDKIYVNDVNGSGQKYTFVIASDQAAGATRLTVNSQTIDYDIRVGAIIGIDNLDLIEQYQRKTEGSIGGMPVTANSIGKYSITGGNYYMVGVDTLYVKILPNDFMVNDDASSPDITPAVFGDGTNTGVSVENTAQELIATVNIPSGTTATEVYIWGSNTTKSVEVYEMDIDANGKGSTVGTGVTDGAAISIGTIASSDTNYLMIKVLVSSTNHRIWGGKVTLTQN